MATGQDAQHPELLQEQGWSNDNKKSNPVWQNGHPNCLQTVHGGESHEMMEPPFTFPVNTHGRQPQGQPQARAKHLRRAKPGILIPMPRPMSQELNLGFSYPRLGLCHEKPPLKMTHTPNVHGSGSSSCQDTGPRIGPLTWNLKVMWYIYTKGYYSDLKPHFWNYEIRPTVPTRMGLGGKYT